MKFKTLGGLEYEVSEPQNFFAELSPPRGLPAETVGHLVVRLEGQIEDLEGRIDELLAMLREKDNLIGRAEAAIIELEKLADREHVEHVQSTRMEDHVKYLEHAILSHFEQAHPDEEPTFIRFNQEQGDG